MKSKSFFFVKFAMLLFLFSCATTNQNGSREISQDQYEKGLKYSEWLYNQPIDILAEDAASQDSILIKNEEKSPEKPIQSEKKPEVASAAEVNFAVQVASFHNEDYARSFYRDVTNKFPMYKFRLFYSESLWRILTGNFPDRRDAESLRDVLRETGFPDAWIYHF